MIWQDILMMCVNIIFIISLGNQVITNYKTKLCHISLYTSLPTSIGLFAMSYALFTLNLYLSSGFTAIGGMLWVILFYQEIHYKKSIS